MWPPAGLLRGLAVFGTTSRSISSLIGSSSSSEEEELKKSGSSFSMDLSAPEEQPTFNHLFVKRGSASPRVRVSPAAMSMEQKVGELRLAARWSGVFPPNVQALTSARSWKHKDVDDIRVTLQVDVNKLRPLLCRYLGDEQAGHLEQVFSDGQVEGGVPALLLRLVYFGSALHQQTQAALAVPPHSQVKWVEA